MLTEGEALALLAGATPITYDQLDEVFSAFGFLPEFEAPATTWYRHADYERCGEFRAEPRYEFSVLSDAQRAIVRRMLACVQNSRNLEKQV